MKNWIIISILLLSVNVGLSQTFPEGISYQAQVNGSDGNFLSGVTIGVEFNIRNTSIDGSIAWQETHTVTLSDLGHFSLIIGNGISTGVGTSPSFEEIDWQNGPYFIEMLVDEENTGDYVSSITQQMMSVPFAFHAKTTSQKYALSQLTDVDTAGIEIGDVLKWDGENWIASEDLVPDTVSFALESGSSIYADTADYAIVSEIPTLVDSSNYAYYADSVNYATDGLHSTYADTAIYADTATVTDYAYNNWGFEGNDNVEEEHFLGTIDSTDLVIKSNGTERMRIKANGTVGIGTDDPKADFHVNNVNGVLYTGEFGVGTIPTEGAGARMMWHPRKAAFRSGFVTSFQWNEAFIGDYSFGAGYNTRASGDYGVAFGFNTQATGDYSFAAGNASISSGDYAFSAGHNPQATGNHSIALGRGALAFAESAIAIGYHPTADAPYALSLGHYTYAHGNNSVAIGYHAEALHEGSFIFNDKEDPFGYYSTTAENQFMVRATGGTVFYTDADLTTGVELLPGAGSWSILSDRNRKKNIEAINAQNYLNRLDNIDVYSWSYKSQDSSVTHIGPMAQDFFKTFELGTDSTTINSGDFDGINLLLIKALDEKVKALNDQSTEMAALNEELEALKAQRKKLYQLLLEIESKLEDESTISENSSVKESKSAH